METFFDTIRFFDYNGNMKIIEREIVNSIIKQYAGKKVIKVLAGIRRCGKSFILRQIRDKLKSELEYCESQIIYIDFEDLRNRNLLNHINLFDFITERTGRLKQKKACLLFDEIQEVEGWERVVNSFYSQEDFNYDIFITGSNAKLLSSELSTLISGRFVNIEIHPFSYCEFLEANELKDSDASFEAYMRYGGFPGLADFIGNENAITGYLGGIYSTILLKDVISRNKIRDAALLEKLILFLFDNMGNVFSGKSIHNFMKSEKRSLSVETIYDYIGYLANALCFRKIGRFDVKGKRLLETMEKYYAADWGLKYHLLGFDDKSVPGLLENIVFIELLRRGWNVKIGKIDDLEIDFVAEKNGVRHYFQVSYLLASEQTMEREYKPLLKIKDSFPKTILSLDALPLSNENGIVRMNIRDFLLQREATSNAFYGQSNQIV